MYALGLLASSLLLVVSASPAPSPNDWTVKFYSSAGCAAESLTGTYGGKTFYDFVDVTPASPFVSVTDNHNGGASIGGVYVCSDEAKSNCAFLPGTGGCKKSTVGDISSFLIF
ncbi:hypothetical protein NQ176_g4384 [Zarea fungicola]|uniref:Uncharacterized protein n=1 Tax=Zarea fungicola TaxID=93591 RepID=A0ACC1NED6_9HYPO|nr:hypothetical protein NQ176_g4384 [Lecanicillium fungicola]